MKFIKLKSLVKNLLNEKISRADEQDIRGVLGRPFDDYIVYNSVVIDDHSGAEDSNERGYTYKWKLKVPLDDLSLFKEILTSEEETLEEKILTTINEKLTTKSDPRDGQYTTGTAEVFDRKVINGKKYLFIDVELIVRYSIE
jgi:hypothetical protein